MAVYVDDADIPYRGMLMSHLVADSKQELFDMVAKIGVARRHIQYEDTWKEHFDIAKGKRLLAIQNGAIWVPQKELGRMVKARREDGQLGKPERTLT